MYDYKYLKNRKLKNEFDKLFELDNSFLLPPLSIKNTIKEMLFRLKYDNQLIQNLYSKNINSINYNLNQLLTYKDYHYSKVFEIDFSSFVSLIWRFAKHYEPECLAIFYENFINIDTNTDIENHTKNLYHYYKMHLEDKDDIFTLNLI